MSQTVERGEGGGGASAAAPDLSAAHAEGAGGAQPIDVRAYFSLAAFLSPPGRSMLAHFPGLTVGAVAVAVGVPVEQVGFVLRNGCRAESDDPVAPGDRVAFFPDYVPYHKVYGACIV